MRALTLTGLQQIAVEQVPEPGLVDPSDVIVRVDKCAVCGSDLHIYHEKEKGCDHGTIMGHEFVGEIVEIGQAVSQFKIGSKVISPFTTSCGQCHFCKIGLSSRCLNGQLYGWKHQGVGLEGGQAQYVRVPLADSTLVEVLEGLNTDRAVLMGDVFPTGYYCALQAEVSPRGIYAILGCGPVGLMAVLSAKILGAQQIFAVDSVPERLDKAEFFGASPINYSLVDPVEVVKEHTGGIGLDSVLEVVGSPQAVRLAYQMIRPGGIIASVGVHTSSQFPFSPVEAYDKNIIFKSGRCPVRSLIDKLQPLVRDQDLSIDDIITHHLALSQGPEAYRIFDQKADGCLKVVLSP